MIAKYFIDITENYKFPFPEFSSSYLVRSNYWKNSEKENLWKKNQSFFT